mgnify:FL=1
MRIVAHLCPHGLDPGPYRDWSEAHRSEHRWLFDLYAGLFKATHVMFPTESVTRDNDFSPDKLAWFIQEVNERGMIGICWIDKWLWTRDITQAKKRLDFLIKPLLGLNVVWNLSNELDLLWLLHPVDRGQVLENLAIGKAHIMLAKAPESQIWAGGATVDGTTLIGDILCPDVLTWTAWRAIQRGLSGSTVLREVSEDLKTILPHAHRELAMIEAGWSVAHQTGIQAAVLRDCLIAAQAYGVSPGLWLPIDTIHGTRDEVEKRYGLLDGDTAQPRPSVEIWRQYA